MNILRRFGIVVAIIGALFSFVGALLTPHSAIATFMFFSIIAGGLALGRAWAGYGGALCLMSGTLVAALRFPVSPALATNAGIAAVLALAGWSTGKRSAPGNGGLPWPWLAAAITYSLWAFSFAVFEVWTGTMDDALLAGDRILVQRVLPGRIKTGDLIVFANPSNRSETRIARVTTTVSGDYTGKFSVVGYPGLIGRYDIVGRPIMLISSTDHPGDVPRLDRYFRRLH